MSECFAEDGLSYGPGVKPYDVRHLVAHLVLSTRADDVHELLAAEESDGRNLWFALKDAHSDIAGYRADVGLALRHVRDHGAVGTRIGREIRYALILGSTREHAVIMPPSLVAALVEKGVWTPEAGLAHARQIPDLDRRVRTLALTAPHLPPPVLRAAVQQELVALRRPGAEHGLSFTLVMGELCAFTPDDLVDDALTTAAALREDIYRADVLQGLASRLPEDRFTRALGLLTGMKDEYRARVLGEFGRYVPDGALDLVLKAIDDIGDPGFRVSAMASAARRTPLDRVKAGLRAMPEVPGGWAEWRAITAIGPELPEELVPVAFAAASGIGDERYRINAVIALAPRLTADLAGRALATMCSEQADEEELLAALVPRLSDEDLPRALELARCLKSSFDRVLVLTALALRHNGEDRDRLFAEAWRNAEERGPYLVSDVDALARLVEVLPEPMLDDAARFVQAGGNYASLTSARVAVARRLTGQRREAALRETLHSLRGVTDEFGMRAGETRVLAPALSRPLLWEAIEEVQQGAGDRWEVRARLEPLVPFLDAEQLTAALSIAREVHDSVPRSRALAALVPHLGARGRATALRHVLDLAGRTADLERRAEVLAAIAPHLGDDLWDEALAAVDRIRSERARSQAVAGLSAFVPESVVDRATALVEPIGYMSWAALALVRLSVHGDDDRRARLVRRALESARQVNNSELGADETRVFAEVLHAVADLAPEPLLPEAVEVASRLSAEDQAAVLTAVVRRAGDEHRATWQAEAVRVARGIRDLGWRARALGRMNAAAPEVREAVAKIADVRWRGFAQAELGHGLPEEALAEAERALGSPSREEGWTSWTDQTLYVGLLPHTPARLVPRVLETLSRLESAYGRAEAVAALAPRLADHHLPAALELVDGSRDRDALDALAALARRYDPLPLPQLEPLWARTCAVLDRASREDVLHGVTVMAGFLARLGGRDAAEDAAESVRQVGSWFP
ncbi:hypothetical protein [Lentzea sp. CA-135723]|uniref:hypothetical protein n=1 Tax=Lentzea sp. CA-135723 TaxID=3239950 RepID=UPI003D8D0CCF